MIVVKDANGQYVPVREEELVEAFARGVFSLYGFTMKDFLEFKACYESLAGPYPATPESIRKTLLGEHR